MIIVNKNQFSVDVTGALGDSTADFKNQIFKRNAQGLIFIHGTGAEAFKNFIYQTAARRIHGPCKSHRDAVTESLWGLHDERHRLFGARVIAKHSSVLKGYLMDETLCLGRFIKKIASKNELSTIRRLQKTKRLTLRVSEMLVTAPTAMREPIELVVPLPLTGDRGLVDMFKDYNGFGIVDCSDLVNTELIAV